MRLYFNTTRLVNIIYTKIKTPNARNILNYLKIQKKRQQNQLRIIPGVNIKLKYQPLLMTK